MIEQASFHLCKVLAIDIYYHITLFNTVLLDIVKYNKMIMYSVVMTLNLLQMEWPRRAKWNGGVRS